MPYANPTFVCPLLVQAAAGSVSDVTFGGAGGAPGGKSLSTSLVSEASAAALSSAARYYCTGRVIFSVSGQAFVVGVGRLGHRFFPACRNARCSQVEEVGGLVF